MVWRDAKRQLIAGCAVAGCLGIASMTQAQLFRPFSDHRTALLEGNWQSCREDDGTYAERWTTGKWPGFRRSSQRYITVCPFSAPGRHRNHSSPRISCLCRPDSRRPPRAVGRTVSIWRSPCRVGRAKTARAYARRSEMTSVFTDLLAGSRRFVKRPDYSHNPASLAAFRLYRRGAHRWKS
jgi:hypothetical protein